MSKREEKNAAEVAAETREAAAKLVERWISATTDRAVQSLLQRIANEIRKLPDPPS